MFGLIGKIFGSDKALGGIVSGVTNGLDKLTYTSEEKADDAAKERTEARQMLIKWMEASQGQNLARRFIAISTTIVWLAQFVIAQALSVVAIFLDDGSKLYEAAGVLRTGVTDIMPAVMLILGFYFAAPYMGGIAKAVTGKFVQETKQK